MLYIKEKRLGQLEECFYTEEDCPVGEFALYVVVNSVSMALYQAIQD